ncbi:MAG TPA: NgoMIV family type II restriction endonuclease [Sedimentisphaerales bacterium]|nr:NgoMIV family type II restriction endonuclease [Sedimentisphaerales bacterium]
MGEILRLREDYHKRLCEHICGYRPGTKNLNISDTGNQLSKDVSQRMVSKFGIKISEKDVSPQRIGQQFAEITKEFVEKAFEMLGHLRPGVWHFSTSQATQGIAAFEQYAHLSDVQRILNDNPELKTALGGDYLITPDVIVAREAEPDERINENQKLVDVEEDVVCYSPLRRVNVPQSPLILHASISCKWTIRSDRAQNTRTEALNLIRNRKGNTPHIVAVTFEPLPGRLSSLALGTGDLDCMYHVALPELQEAIRETRSEDHIEQIETLVNGRRLRDMSDLPVDLAI